MQRGGQSQEVVNPIQTPDGKEKRLLQIGMWASTAYLVPMLIYSLVEWSHMKAMKPDEFATFLSGAFAPLAFLWLVLGFRQQGDELQNSARALWLQGEELRNSVEQQRQLVEVTREQLDSERLHREFEAEAAIREAFPRIVFTTDGLSTSGNQTSFSFAVISAGPPCTEFNLIMNGKRMLRRPLVAAEERLAFEVHFEKIEHIAEQMVEITFVDIRQRRGTLQYRVPLSSSPHRQDRPVFGEPELLETRSVG